MSRFALTRPIPRLLLGTSLALLPLVTAWNLAVAPGLEISIGPKLGGVTLEAPVTMSWSSLRDGSLQKAVASRLTEAFAIRPLLIRINNEIRFGLFGATTAPQLVRGSKGQLIGQNYLDEYCSRTEGQGIKLAAGIIPKLRAIQDYYSGRGGVFVYVVSPSKAAHLPEHFLDRFSCPSTPAARAQLVPQYVNALKDSGINVLDGAGLIHGLKGRYEVDLFPQGGEHWNDLGGALVVSAMVKEINARAGREIVPPFTFNYTLSRPAGGADRELADLLNVFFPPLGYLTPKVNYVQSTPCGQGATRTLDAAIVGSSFGHLPASILIEHNCLSALKLYYYARLGRFGGVPYRELQRSLGDSDLAALGNVKLMIIEENEFLIGRSGYVDEVLRVVGR
jgi:alginate O-acetyltransferase complex protein AlgJ